MAAAATAISAACEPASIVEPAAEQDPDGPGVFWSLWSVESYLSKVVQQLNVAVKGEN